MILNSPELSKLYKKVYFEHKGQPLIAINHPCCGYLISDSNGDSYPQGRKSLEKKLRMLEAKKAIESLTNQK